MSHDNIKKLPSILQTDTLTNFFETTVDQLFTKANAEVLKGYIGTRTSDDKSLASGWVEPLNVQRTEYALSPVINTLNANTGVSENFIYFDELINILNNAGVDTRNQNTLFGTEFTAYLPPIDIDKLINYQNYYWDPDGPQPIDVNGSLAEPIDVTNDILGKKTFTPLNGKPFKNGMVIKFVGDYIIPSTYSGITYIVEGVGTSIVLVPKKDNFNTQYATLDLGQWDATAFSLTENGVVHSAGNVTAVNVVNPGVGYVNASVTLSNISGTYTNVATISHTANIYNGGIDSITVTNSNVSHLYTGQIGISVVDTGVNANIVEPTTFNNASEVSTRVVRIDSLAGVVIGQNAVFENVTSQVIQKNTAGVNEVLFTGEANVRIPGYYLDVPSTTITGVGSGATFDVVIDSGIVSVANISAANTNRVAGTYLNVTPELCEYQLSNAEVEASVGGNIVGAYSSLTASYSLNDIVEYNNFFYRMLQSNYTSSNPHWPVLPTTDTRSTLYWQIVPRTNPSEGQGATFDITIDSLGAATSVTVNTPGDGYLVGEQVQISIADLGGPDDFVEGDLFFKVSAITGNVTSISVNQFGNSYTVSDTITIADSDLGGSLSNALQFNASVISNSITVAEQITLSNSNLNVHFEGTGFVGQVVTDRFAFTTDANCGTIVEILNAQAIAGIDPNDPTNYYLMGGEYAWDKLTPPSITTDNIVIQCGGSGYTSAPTVIFSGGATVSSTITTPATAVATVSGGEVTAITLTNTPVGYEFTPTITLVGGGGTGAVAYFGGEGEASWGGEINQREKDYFVISRGAQNKNVWSRVNFWHHISNYTDSSSPEPSKSNRAQRPIIEFDRNVELYNHGTRSRGSVLLSAGTSRISDINGMSSNVFIDSTAVISGSTIIFPEETPELSKYVYQLVVNVSTNQFEVSSLELDGQPFTFSNGDTIAVVSGLLGIGQEFVYNNETGLQLTQNKVKVNQPPLFKLYNDERKYLGDETYFPNSTFAGNKIFSIKEGTGSVDSHYGFPVAYKQFKNTSEILFEDSLATEIVTYPVISVNSFGETETTNVEVIGEYYYKLLGDNPTYHNTFKNTNRLSKQRIITRYQVSQNDIDSFRTSYKIGATPNVNSSNPSGYDVTVFVNGNKDYAWEYTNNSIEFLSSRTFNTDDLIDIFVYSDTGLLNIANNPSVYELPVLWGKNYTNNDIVEIAQPEFLPHFKSYFERQEGFAGDALNINNFADTAQESVYADTIIKSSDNLILGAFLLDDRPHNLLDAFKFNGREFSRYKRRLLKELTDYYFNNDTSNLTNRELLELVIRKVVSYSVGKTVFNQTYVLPFGDNYIDEEFIINDVNQTVYTLDTSADLDMMENTMLVYYTNIAGQQRLLHADEEYTRLSVDPIKIELASGLNLDTTGKLTFHIYNENRDSAECPPTPSTMGILPLIPPHIENDTSFATPIKMIVGHDGSKTPVFDDIRDSILLEFEWRMYTSAKKAFRESNSLPSYNQFNIRPGHFRQNRNDWVNLLVENFNSWVLENKVDPVTNEFFDSDNEWTWNYSNSTLPGYWKGWYEYHYDTIRPHTHPWEMLGFTEKPTWWEAQYGTDYGSSNNSMWADLENGIIRQGPRANTEDDFYLHNNPYRRVGLSSILPVDESAELISPYRITSTDTTTKLVNYLEAVSNTSAGISTTSFDLVDGLNVSFDSNNVYVVSNNIPSLDSANIGTLNGLQPVVSREITFNIPRVNLTTVAESPHTLGSVAVGILTNGMPLYNPKNADSFNNEGEWHYNAGWLERTGRGVGIFAHTDETGLVHTHVPVSQMFDADKWGAPGEHSGIVGWAFDGLPVYGPYGYKEYYSNGSVRDNSITNIKSPFELRTGLRKSGPGGAYTGAFVEDYQYNASVGNTAGYTGRYNRRLGVTPDSPTTPISFYVVTMDDNNNPMFPYAVGGGTTSHTGSSVVYGGKYFAQSQDIDNNTLSSGYTSASATTAITSTRSVTQSASSDISGLWKFGDGSPVEHAWKYSSQYQYAIAEALLLNNPGRFAVQFANPTKIINPIANRSKSISAVSRQHWNFADKNDFTVHGETDDNGNFISVPGYTTFINTWLKFQGLSIVDNFTNDLRTLNLKLGTRLEGFIDKDTMTLSLDQYSNTGAGSNLILPAENITVTVHNSPAITRNYYSGVVIEKTGNGYKVSGYDTKFGYFNILESDPIGPRERIKVGGEPVGYVKWQPDTGYVKGDIVEYSNGYFEARTDIAPTNQLIYKDWKSLKTLPTTNWSQGTLYQATTGNIIKVYYGTEYTSIDDVFDFLISLGRYQQYQGYNFDNIPEGYTIPSDWKVAAESFLYWTTGRWESGNTLELSPLSKQVDFNANFGYISHVQKSSNYQYSLVDRAGQVINPDECAFIREHNSIKILPPANTEFYGVLLQTKLVEHAMVIDNVTDFADTIYNTLLDQKHSRLKIKATRTGGWNGRFLSSGFIISGDELLPNLDNIVETTGRYYDLGYIPVDNQIYNTSRQMFGYVERDYLNELGINDDEQFNFYRGMIHNKGTKESLSRIAKSNSIVQGSMTVFDEWALKIGEFGDTLNDQSIELKIDKADVVQDPQLLTLAFPEDTTGYIEKIDVLLPRHTYYDVPTVEVSAPAGKDGKQATAVATVVNGVLSSIKVTDGGYGYSYDEGVSLNIVAGNINLSNVNSILTSIDAVTTADVSIQYFAGNSNVNVSYVGNANITNLGTITITDNITSNVASLNLSGVTSLSDIATLINETATINATISAKSFTNEIADPGDSGANIAPTYTIYERLSISGSDFTVAGNASSLANIGLDATRYQPKQRYSVDVANNTVKADIIVKMDGNIVDPVNYVFDSGDRWKINAPTTLIGNTSVSYVLNTGLLNASTNFDANNIISSNNVYEFIDLYIDGNHIEETLYQVSNTSTIYIPNVNDLPNRSISAGANVYVVEKATIDFEDAYQGDLPGSTLNITVFTNDEIAIKVGQKRIYEITPDAKDDEVILIDIDDTSRFLKKPSGVRENNLWPTTANVSYHGLVDEKYRKMPNAGYVTRASVDYQAFAVKDLPDLFSNVVRFKPEQNDHIHVASSENKDWNVYKLDKIAGSLSFVEKESKMTTAHLYTNYSLFNYVDSNQLQENDLSRYLDYFLVIKNANVTDELVIWTNEQIVNKKSIRITDFNRPAMVEANVISIGPHANSVLSIANISPGIGKVFLASSTQTDANGIVAVTDQHNQLQNGDTVTFYDSTRYYYDYAVTGTSYISVTDQGSLSTASNVLTFSHDAEYVFGEVKYNSNSAVIGLEAFEFATNSTSNTSVSYINKSNVVIPNSFLSATPTTVDLVRLKTNELNISLANINFYGSNFIQVNDYIELITANSTYQNAIYQVNNVYSANNTIRVSSPTFLEDNGNIVDISAWGVTSIRVNRASNIHATTHTVSNVTASGFTVNQAGVIANVDYGNLSYTFYSKTKITTATNHNIVTGDMVKLIANAYTGYYYVDSCNGNSFIINKPYISSIPKSGNVITKGVTIVTSDPHGIHPAYSGKRVAVHVATPRLYNQIYKVTGVGVADVYASTGSNIENRYTVISNASVISNANAIATANAIFIDNAFAFADVGNVQNKAVVTTIDHNKITLNNAVIAIDNLNNEQAVVESFNRQMQVRRGFTRSDSFTLAFPMLNSILPSTQLAIGNGPYVTNNASTYPSGVLNGLTTTGSIQIPLSTVQNTNFGTTVATPNPGWNPTIGLAPIPTIPTTVTTFNLPTGITMPGAIPGVFGTSTIGTTVPLTTTLPATSSTTVVIPTVLANTTTSGPGSAPGTVGVATTAPNPGAPIIDPVKVMVAVPKKDCGNQASNCPPDPNSGSAGAGAGGVPAGYTKTTIWWPEWVSVGSVTGTGKGARDWGTAYSGYYYYDSNKTAQHVGGNDIKFGVAPRGILGATTWSQNGSTETITMTVNFAMAGRFSLHCYQLGLSSYSTSRVEVAGSGIITESVFGRYAEYDINANNLTTLTFDVEDGASVTITATSKADDTEWHAIGFHLSASPNDIAPSQSALQAVPPAVVNTPGNVDRHWHEQSTTKTNVDDDWYFECANNGMVKIVFYMDAAADGFEIYQGHAKGQETRKVSDTSARNLQYASATEKQELAVARQGTGTAYANYGSFQDYKVSTKGVENNTGVLWCGKIEWMHDTSYGNFIKVHVWKSSNVYHFMIDLPKTPPPPPPPSNPTPIGPCDVPIWNPNTSSVVANTSGPTTPAFTPAGTPVTTGTTTTTTTPSTTTTTYGSTTSSGSNGGGGCPDPDMNILVDQHNHKRAGDLQVGDLVYTRHEHTKEWGFFEVTVKEIYQSPKMLFVFTDSTTVVVSESHKFSVGNKWVTAKAVAVGTVINSDSIDKVVEHIEPAGVGDVVKLEIDQAHTYVVNGLLSHNKFFTGFASGKYGRYMANYAGWGQPLMSGYSMIPSVLRKGGSGESVKLPDGTYGPKTTKKVAQNNYGVFKPLASGRYINATHQRVTGGKLIPLAQPLERRIPIKPRALEVSEFINYPGLNQYGTGDRGFFRSGTRVNLVPTRVSSDVTLGHTKNTDGTTGFADGYIIDGTPDYTINGYTVPGRPIKNILNDNPDIYTTYDNIDFTSYQPINGVTIFDETSTPETETDISVNITNQYSPIDDDVEWNDRPGIIIQPTKGGIPQNPAICNLVRPTPAISIPLDSGAGIQPGDSIKVNNTTISFKSGDPSAIKSAFTCTEGNFTVATTYKDGSPAIRISSCTNAPLIFRPGCKGGMYKEVLDFHISRGFEQNVSSTSNTAVIPASVGYGGYAGQTGSSSWVNQAVKEPIAPYTLYNVEGTSVGTTASSTPTSGSVLSSYTETYSTGGSGYTVGDRLRLVGGTPVAQPYGSLQLELCIVNPGSGYSAAENIQVLIGDGTSVGTGARVSTVILNAQGGIEKITLSSGGEGYLADNPPVISIVDTGSPTNATLNTADDVAKALSFRQAEVTAKINTGPGYPYRVAKFEVMSVDSYGTIKTLQIIDRGIYKVFPADLTNGVPLEYDYTLLGDETGYELDSNGDVIPGSASVGTGLGQFGPNMERLGTPGDYDPIRGKISGGTGAKVFLTSREIPDCSERSAAKDLLGLPDSVIDVNIPEDLAACFNRALEAAGYDPEDVKVYTEPVNEYVDNLVATFPGFDGVVIDETAPGLLDKLGIPLGSYNADMLCMEMTLNNKDTIPSRYSQSVEGTIMYDEETGIEILTEPDPVAIEITCVESIGPFDIDPQDFLGDEPRYYQDENDPTNANTIVVDPTNKIITYPGQGSLANPKNGQDPNSIFGDGTVRFIQEMYQYELRTIFGEVVGLNKLQQECDVLVFKSARFSENTGSNVNTLFAGSVVSVPISSYDKVWIDNYNDNGWAYLENGNVVYNQEPLVDSKFVKNAIFYDKETGEREISLYEWDPFKGVIPGFLDKEIHYVTESDPVAYKSKKANFGRKDVGKVWWDTSTIKYNWYEQGTARQRWLNWGSAFPGSAITLYEWVESKNLPQNWKGTGTPRSVNQYIEESRVDPISGKYENYYYYWVHNKTDLANSVKSGLNRELDTYTVARHLADPRGMNLPLISYVSNTSFVLQNISNLLREDEQILQINLSRDLNPAGQKHIAWKLLRENDNNSIIPEDLSLKLIDSLCGEDLVGNSVPDPLLSEVEKYGVSFRPRQTMFKDIKEARRLMVSLLNEYFADLKLASNFPGWDSNFVTKTYFEPANWYEVNRIDNRLNKKIRYDSSSKPIYKVGSVQALNTLKSIPHDSIVQVMPNKNSRYELWQFNSKEQKFIKIAMQNETIKLKSTLYTDNTNSIMSSEIRSLLVACRDVIFENTSLWNKFFFECMKHAYSEQQQLSWAFKTSYVYIEKEEEDLVQFRGYRADNFDKVKTYLDEVKPYTTKIRDFKDGKRVPIEYIGSTGLSDFDKPPYADSVSGTVRVLDDYLQEDSNILQTSNEYIKYFGFSSIAGAQSPIRKIKETIKFDRVKYNLLAHDFNPETTAINVSIATNMVTLIAQSNSEVESNTVVVADDRIFKFDPEVIAQFTNDLNLHFSVTDAYSNANIISNIALITSAIDIGALDSTLALVKDKAYGNFRGTLIDSSVFTMVVTGTDATTQYQNVFGFDSTKYASVGFDPSILVRNFVGSFTQPSTYVVNDIIVDGFDGITFQRVGYGEERPPELALFDPYETLIIRVTTSDTYANSAVSANAALVKYQVTMDTYGKTEYMRMLQDGSSNTRLTANFFTYSDKLIVEDVTKLPDPLPGQPGIVWVGSERIEYTRKVGNSLTELLRGTNGTTIQDWLIIDPETGDNVTVEVFDGTSNQVFTKDVPNSTVYKFRTESNVWLDSGAVSLADKGNADISNSSSIMKFLHNL